MHHADFVSADEYDETSSLGQDYDVDSFGMELDFLPRVNSLEYSDDLALPIHMPKKRGRKPLSAGGGSRHRQTDEQLRAMLEEGANRANFALLGRRSRRMRPIDSNKELIVLMPNDDPISKLQLEKNEIPEFVCCMEEKYDWALEDEKLSNGEGFGKGHGGRGRAAASSHDNVVVPEGAEVQVPESRINEDHYVPHRTQGTQPFRLPLMGVETEGSLYASYDLDSEDEDFVEAWQDGKPLSMLHTSSSNLGFHISKNGTPTKSRKSTPHGGSVHVQLGDGAFSELIIALEREYELCKASAPLRTQIGEAKFKCQEYMDSCSELADVADGFRGSKEQINTLEKAFYTHQSLVDTWNVRLERSGSLISMRSDGGKGEDDDADKNVRFNPQADLSELPIVTREELENELPVERACRLLAKIYRTLYALSDGQAKRSAHEDELQLRPALVLIYEYWLQKRSSRRSSLLRCYHNFIMENWKHQEVLPMLTEDQDADALLKAHGQLVKLRHDLDRARLIMDRVRRREKIKKELVRVAGDTTDDFLQTLKAIDPKAEEKEAQAHAKVKGEKRDTKAQSKKDLKEAAQLARQPRAAKSLALVKMDPNSAAHAAVAAGSSSTREVVAAAAAQLEPSEESLIDFTIEDCDYDKLEVPENRSSFGIASASEVMNSHDNSSSGGGPHQGYYSDYDPRRIIQRNQARNNSLQPQCSAASGWTADEDRLLLMGVASCGVGRWTEIREDFLLARNSAQMNQRFTRLARRRCVLAKINASSSNKRGGGNDTPEYTEVRTAFMSAQDVVSARSKLPPLIIGMLENYSEDGIWESIALRHLVDLQSKDKRCGRPQKYPLPIPIPKHLQNGGFMSRRKNIIQRPSELGYNWKGKPAASSSSDGAFDYGGSGSYSRGGYSQSASANSSPSSAKKRARGRPRKNTLTDESESGREAYKKKRHRGGELGSDYDQLDNKRGLDVNDDMMSVNSELSAVSSEWMAVSKPHAAANRIVKQGLSREERARARERKAELDALEISSGDEGDDDDSHGDRGRGRGTPARCSLGNLPVHGKKKGSDSKNSPEEPRSRGRPRGSTQAKPKGKK